MVQQGSCRHLFPSCPMVAPAIKINCRVSCSRAATSKKANPSKDLGQSQQAPPRAADTDPQSPYESQWRLRSLACNCDVRSRPCLTGPAITHEPERRTAVVVTAMRAGAKRQNEPGKEEEHALNTITCEYAPPGRVLGLVAALVSLRGNDPPHIQAKLTWATLNHTPRRC